MTALIIHLALATPQLATSTGTDAPIELQAKHFSITIQPSTCNATMIFNRSAADGFPFQQTKTVGQPTPFLSLYNRVSDNRAQNMEACVGVSAIGASGQSFRSYVSWRRMIMGLWILQSLPLRLVQRSPSLLAA